MCWGYLQHLFLSLLLTRIKPKKKKKMADQGVRVGPWGGSGGGPWEFIPDGRISQISIRSGSVVDAIYFVFTDRSGNNYRSLHFGGPGGFLHEIPLPIGEEIIRISGRYGVFDGTTVITSLTFKTNRNTYGQYGTDGGTDFSLPITKGRIIGFYGMHGSLLDNIGVILCP
ncbi:putative jacalin-like lectin domain-containing protein [Helianthus annuus]|uniref:Jacalin-like lectin domain-containing protein n=2 Tax=Helianthus annuus TaxID=4232 RepID=A0A9K3HU23_HELAN|nr:putative jacalin-like lectin domain-containing protein [Helianthus annuus]